MWLIASVEDPAEGIAGRYSCKDGDRANLRDLIKKDWAVMNNYVPIRLNIQFRKTKSRPEEHEGNLRITALMG